VLIRFGWLRRYLTEASPQVPERPANRADPSRPGAVPREARLAVGPPRQASWPQTNFALECWPATLGRAFFTRAEREQGAGDPHSEIIRLALIGLLGNADAVLHATETGTGRIRTFSCQRLAVLSDAVALSLIAASQRGTGVWIRRTLPAVSWSRITWLVT